MKGIVRENIPSALYRVTATDVVAINLFVKTDYILPFTDAKPAGVVLVVIVMPIAV